MKLAFRPAADSDSPDRAFIISTWSSSYKRSHSAGIINTDDWAAIMHPQFEKVLGRAGSRALIACDRTDPDYFYGWIAGDTTESTPVVYYVYTKEPYRRTGVARSLFAAFGVDPLRYFVYPCGTPDAKMLSSKIPRARFNPNEVRYPKESRRRPL